MKTINEAVPEKFESLDNDVDCLKKALAEGPVALDPDFYDAAVNLICLKRFGEVTDEHVEYVGLGLMKSGFVIQSEEGDILELTEDGRKRLAELETKFGPYSIDG